VIGHEVRLSQTNTYGCVPVCECGWIGTVEAPAAWDNKKGAWSVRRYELTESLAKAQHGKHLVAVREDLVCRSDAEPARIGKLIPLANATLQRRGRYGHS